MGINTHGLKMEGLEKASQETEISTGAENRGYYVQIAYNTEAGEVLTSAHADFTHNNVTKYDNPSIITVCYASSKLSEQHIADKIFEVMQCVGQY